MWFKSKINMDLKRMLVLPAFVLLLGIVSADDDEVEDKVVVRAVVEVYILNY